MNKNSHYICKISIVYFSLISLILLLNIIHKSLFNSVSNYYNNIIIIINYLFTFTYLYYLNQKVINQKILLINIKKYLSILLLIIFFTLFTIYKSVLFNWVGTLSIRDLEMSVGAGILEEYVFRGIILLLFLKMFNSKNNNIRTNCFLSIISSSLLFSFLHILNIITISQNIIITLVQIMFTISIGIINSTVYLKTFNLLVPVIMHILWDLMSSTKLLNQNYTFNELIFILIFLIIISIFMSLLTLKKKSTKKITKKFRIRTKS
ncbi:hypothetical protein WR164_01060 [Philodulcilactobacillus myokoensis]|uniref:CAAX prenyl protease 2/Lysostaphin resistance protein A-like domain-containing protein n=1 Tax=Philodulcilactobacillus myokoensis TaxID=2929573 RepID=A0A9W6AYR5_9LACO|nr:hypothetical protein WR164_01060 [Philodulcilactobacillus myokoensis]